MKFHSIFPLMHLVSLSGGQTWVSAFSPSRIPCPRKRKEGTSQLFISREEYLRPHFERPHHQHQTTTRPSKHESSTLDYGRIQECTNGRFGECSIEEMSQLMEELEKENQKATVALGADSSGDEDELDRPEALRALRRKVQQQKDLDEQLQSYQDMFQHMRELADYESH